MEIQTIQTGSIHGKPAPGTASLQTQFTSPDGFNQQFAAALLGQTSGASAASLPLSGWFIELEGQIDTLLAALQEGAIYSDAFPSAGNAETGNIEPETLQLAFEQLMELLYIHPNGSMMPPGVYGSMGLADSSASVTAASVTAADGDSLNRLLGGLQQLLNQQPNNGALPSQIAQKLQEILQQLKPADDKEALTLEAGRINLTDSERNQLLPAADTKSSPKSEGAIPLDQHATRLEPVKVLHHQFQGHLIPMIRSESSNSMSLQLINVTMSSPIPVIQADRLPQQMGDFLVKQFSWGQVNGRSEATIKLFPEQLGQVDIKLTMQNGLLAAQFLTETLAGKETIENQLNQLRATLHQLGFQVDKVEVQQSSLPNDQVRGENLFQQQQHRQQQEQSNSKRQNEPNTVEAVFELPDAGADVHLDIDIDNPFARAAVPVSRIGSFAGINYSI